jgi:hypothetical protein
MSKVGKGNNTHIVSSSPFSSHGLLRRIADKVVIVRHQKKPPKKRCFLTDEQTVECRTLKEFHGWQLNHLSVRYGVSVSVIAATVYGITNMKQLWPKSPLENPPKKPDRKKCTRKADK